MMFIKTIPSYTGDKEKEEKDGEITELKTAEEIEEYFKNID